MPDLEILAVHSEYLKYINELNNIFIRRIGLDKLKFHNISSSKEDQSTDTKKDINPEDVESNCIFLFRQLYYTINSSILHLESLELYSISQNEDSESLYTNNSDYNQLMYTLRICIDIFYDLHNLIFEKEYNKLLKSRNKFITIKEKYDKALSKGEAYYLFEDLKKQATYSNNFIHTNVSLNNLQNKKYYVDHLSLAFKSIKYLIVFSCFLFNIRYSSKDYTSILSYLDSCSDTLSMYINDNFDDTREDILDSFSAYENAKNRIAPNICNRIKVNPYIKKLVLEELLK